MHASPVSTSAGLHSGVLDRLWCVPLGASLVLACTAPAAPPTASTPDVSPAPADAAATPPPSVPAVIPPPGPPAATAPDPTPPVEPSEPDAAEPPPLAAVPAAPPDARFQLAAYRDSGELELHLLGDEVFVSGAGGLAHQDARGRLVPVAYGLTGQQEDEWGSFESWEVLSLGGLWPDNAWLVTEYGVSRDSSPPLMHRRADKRWQKQANKRGVLYEYYEHIVTWHSGQVVGLRTYTVDPGLYESTDENGELPKRIERKIKTQLAATRRGFDLLGPTSTPTAMVLADDISTVLHVAAAATGELFLLGHHIVEYNDHRPRLQRWGRDGAATVLDALPAGVACTQLTVGAADEAYLGCSSRGESGVARLLRFDGAAWSEEPAPKGRLFESLSLAPGGELWAIVSDVDEQQEHQAPGAIGLWRRPARGAAWELAELPALRFADRAYPEWAFNLDRDEYVLQPADPAAAERTWTVRPTQVLARGPDDVWVVGKTELEREGLTTYSYGRSVLLRNRKVAAPLRMLPDGDLRMEREDWDSAPTWKPHADPVQGCPDELSGFVALRTLPRDAPRNQPEPLVEALVRDHSAALADVSRIVEVFRRGRRTVGLHVLPKDQAAADALLAALAQVAPGEPRQIECREPRIRRSFDKQTGLASEAPAI